MSSIESLTKSFYRALRPAKKMTVSEWADENAYLSAESSAEPGRWRTIPYQRGIMDAFTDPEIEQIWVQKSARVGWTKCLGNVIGYHIHQDPCSIMMVQPTDVDAEGYSKEELAPMIRDTPALSALVSDVKAKDGGNTLLAKTYPGGVLGLVGANSPRGFRRVSRRVVLFDEVDGYPASAGSEGDPIKLGIKRTEYYWNRKIGGGSTPLVKDFSRIEKLFESGDQCRYYVPCPQCGHMQYLKWSNLKWPEGEPDKAYYMCEANGCVISHDDKVSMIENGEWRATAKGLPRVKSFHIWAAYSYSPNSTWGDIASEFLDAKKDKEQLQTFVNLVLGETWEEEYAKKIGADALEERAEFYESSVVPEGAVVVTAGVDVQDNRLSVALYAWGLEEEAWALTWFEIFGDPARPEVWKQLDEVLLKPLRHANGTSLVPIHAAAIDSGGHHTHEVYQYARERKRHGTILATKGQSQRNKPPIGKATKVDLNFRGQVLKGGAEVYPMGSDTIKSTIYGRLKNNEPGPGFFHFHTDLGREFFEQLTVEKQVTRFLKGFPILEWVKPNGKRNEALDCTVMAYAALQWLYTRYNRKTIWEQFSKKLGSDPEKQRERNQNRQPEPSSNRLFPKGRGGFVSRY